MLGYWTRGFKFSLMRSFDSILASYVRLLLNLSFYDKRWHSFVLLFLSLAPESLFGNIETRRWHYPFLEAWLC